MDGVVRAPSEFSITLADCRGARAGARVRAARSAGGTPWRSAQRHESHLALHHSHAAVGGAQIDADDLAALRAAGATEDTSARRASARRQQQPQARRQFRAGQRGSVARRHRNRGAARDATQQAAPERAHGMAQRARLAEGGGPGAEQATPAQRSEHWAAWRATGALASLARARRPLDWRAGRTGGGRGPDRAVPAASRTLLLSELGALDPHALARSASLRLPNRCGDAGVSARARRSCAAPWRRSGRPAGLLR